MAAIYNTEYHLRGDLTCFHGEFYCIKELESMQTALRTRGLGGVFHV